MADLTSSTKRGASGAGPDALTERVRQRVTLAGLAFDRRSTASRPKSRRRKPAQPAELGNGHGGEPVRTREQACLRAVFHELGDAHRAYRARTGQTVTPSLRAATDAFKLDPTLLTLVPVAAFLDELDILAW